MGPLLKKKKKLKYNHIISHTLTEKKTEADPKFPWPVSGGHVFQAQAG